MGIIVVGGIIEKDNKYLLVQEVKDICKNKWNFPAGKLEVGESLLDGAKREIREETGFLTEMLGVLEIGNIIMEDNTFVSVIFAARITNENDIYNSKELLKTNWFTLGEILKMKDDLRHSEHIINAIRNLEQNKLINNDLICVMQDIK